MTDVLARARGPLYGHLGGSTAHSSFVGFEPESGIAIAVLVNVFDAGAAAFLALDSISVLTGKDISPPEASEPSTAAE